MPNKEYKPTSPSLRLRKTADFAELTVIRPEPGLTTTLKSRSGRNNQGRITVRRRGGGVKRKYRMVDFKRDKDNVVATIKTVEYDPYRTAYIALVQYDDGEKRYIIAPNRVKVGQKIKSGDDAEIKIGNTLKLRHIPVGSIIHNIQIHPKGKAQLCRSAGCQATLLAKNPRYANIKLPSGEVRLVLLDCVATIGQVSNTDKRNEKVGKAGINRMRGRRPKVRGSVMNPVDHPHGGGEGKAPIGRSGPVSKWGKNTMGKKTRKSNKSNRLIVSQSRR